MLFYFFRANNLFKVFGSHKMEACPLKLDDFIGVPVGSYPLHLNLTCSNCAQLPALHPRRGCILFLLFFIVYLGLGRSIL